MEHASNLEKRRAAIKAALHAAAAGLAATAVIGCAVSSAQAQNGGVNTLVLGIAGQFTPLGAQVGNLPGAPPILNQVRTNLGQLPTSPIQPSPVDVFNVIFGPPAPVSQL